MRIDELIEKLHALATTIGPEAEVLIDGEFQIDMVHAPYGMCNVVLESGDLLSALEANE